MRQKSPWEQMTEGSKARMDAYQQVFDPSHIPDWALQDEGEDKTYPAKEIEPLPAQPPSPWTAPQMKVNPVGDAPPINGSWTRLRDGTLYYKIRK